MACTNIKKAIKKKKKRIKQFENHSSPISHKLAVQAMRQGTFVATQQKRENVCNRANNLEHALSMRTSHRGDSFLVNSGTGESIPTLIVGRSGAKAQLLKIIGKVKKIEGKVIFKLTVIELQCLAPGSYRCGMECSWESLKTPKPRTQTQKAGVDAIEYGTKWISRKASFSWREFGALLVVTVMDMQQVEHSLVVAFDFTDSWQKKVRHCHAMTAFFAFVWFLVDVIAVVVIFLVVVLSSSFCCCC